MTRIRGQEDRRLAFCSAPIRHPWTWVAGPAVQIDAPIHAECRPAGLKLRLLASDALVYARVEETSEGRRTRYFMLAAQ